MALGSNHQTTTTGATFIPELWSDEVIAGYKANLVLGNLVTKINHAGKKGDTIHIPAPVRGSANVKAANTQVTLHDGTTLYTGGTPNDTDLTDAGIRAMILKLDNADVPSDNRFMVIPPIAANDMLGINRFTEQQFIGNGDAIKTGKIGSIYGMDVYVSSNCPSVDSGGGRVGIMAHKDAFCLAEQMGVRSQTQYKQEYLGDLFTADTLYGVAELRDNAGVAFVVPAT
jgi:hypothetical protein